MSGTSLADRLAVCSWSLRPTGPEDLIAKLKQVGIGTVQLALGPVWAEKAWAEAGARLAAAGVRIVSGQFGSVGEDYTTLESIRRTGGIVPDATWEENWRNVWKTIETAKALGVKYVSFHAGFLPEEPSDPAYGKLTGRLLKIADAFAAEGIDLGMETGQEDAPTLKRFLQRLNKPNVGVNFDPANMILYGKGDPVQAAGTLLPYVRQVHVKDAVATRQSGTWGSEVVVGTGAVDWKRFFAVLAEGGFAGPLSIEREAGDQRVADIQAAARFVIKTAGPT